MRRWKMKRRGGGGGLIGERCSTRETFLSIPLFFFLRFKVSFSTFRVNLYIRLAIEHLV